MPSPELPPKDREPVPYYQAALFRAERPAEHAYVRAQQVVLDYQGKVELSAYRFLLHRLSHVAVIGDPPPEELHRRITAVLSGGEATALPREVLSMLAMRRAEATKLGPWVEGHYRADTPSE